MFTISGYHIYEQLYESAHSLVYRGYRSTDDHPVVLKVLRDEYPTPQEIARFRREYEMTRNLDVDGVIDVDTLESYKNTLVMILEDFGGESLTRLLPNHSLEVREFLRLAIRISEILGRIHQQQIMHKDINPSNIVWNPSTDQLRIIDFGISTALSREQPEIRNPHVLEGTLAYMSPEQTGRMNRVMDYRTDLYSLGATYYHLLTGNVPFQTEDAMELVHCHLAKMPMPPYEFPGSTGVSPASVPQTSSFAPAVPGGIPKVLSDIILKLMAKTAEDRYQSAFGLKADLQKCLDQLTATAIIEGFEIAQHDVLDRFQIPQKLYGREHEIHTLLQAFDRIATPQSTIDNPFDSAQDKQQSTIEMILVAGYAGIGKSALVHEIYKPITEKHGYFISGKFDQFKHNIPYSALIQAFQALIHQLLTEPEDQLSLWKEKLLDALGANGQVIVEVISEVELIIGPQPAMPELPPAQAQNRFNLVFQNFVRTCAAAEHPLVLFLDDLQWADVSSLQLLELLMTDPNMNHMLFIGAYRDNEVFDAHPLILKLQDIQHTGTIVNTMTLTPLTLEHVNHLIADTLQSQTKVCTPLAELSLRKTGGNPFFLNQFLHALYKEGFLEYEYPSVSPVYGEDLKGGWQWELDKIQKAQMTDNVVELMAGKIQKLPKETQDVLRLAACIGNQFDLHTLSIVYEKSQLDTLHDLWDALQEELIIPLDDTYKYVENVETQDSRFTFHVSRFTFLHDRIQQAAYSLIEEEHKYEVHLKIGRLLLSNILEAEQEEKIFEIVDHLNIGKDLIIHQAKKDELAQLNLMAGKKAKVSAAYQAAFTYMQAGIALVEGDCPEPFGSAQDKLCRRESWQRQYDLTLSLYVEAAEAAYLSGNFEAMERLVEVVLENANTLLDKVKAYEVKIQAYTAQNKLLEAIMTGLPVLKLLGVRLPRKPNTFHIMRELFAVKCALIGKSIENLNKLPNMIDPYKLATIRIALKIAYAVSFTTPELVMLIWLKLVKLLLKHGNTSASAYLYAGYGGFLCESAGNNIDAGYRFGKIALHLLEQFNAREFKAKTLFLINIFIKNWKEHFKESLPSLLEAYHWALEIGDLESAAFSAQFYAYYSYFIGKELAGLEREMASYSAVIGQIKQKTAHQVHNLLRQMILNLIGTAASSDSPPWRLVGEVYSEESMLPLHQQANDRAALSVLYLHKLLLCYLFQAYPQAVEHATLTETYLGAASGVLFVSLFPFYDSLSRLAVYPDVRKSEQKRIFRKVAANQKKLKKWAHHAPMNFLHKWSLVEAERARVRGKDTEAMDYYDRAIEGAKEHGYLNEEALANELAARFYLANGKGQIAWVYMREARYCYLKWGAMAKVRHLDETYPELLRNVLHDERHPSTGSGPRLESGIHLSVTETTSPETGSGGLDLTTVIKASQTISGEIVLENLLTRLMEIIIENAGAQRGLLLFEEDGAWVANAEKDTRPERFLKPLRFEFPTTIINYVARTQDPVVLADATQDSQFTQDYYILAHQPRSVLCTPLLNQGKLVALLYLENTLTPGVFTSKRLEVLHLLSSQAAISIENARLYNTLEHKVEERTAELVNAKETAENAQQAAEAANQAKSRFITNMSHELRTPLNVILGYTQLLRLDSGLTKKQHDAIGTIHRSGEHLLRMINDLLDLSRIEARKIGMHPTTVHLPGFLKHITEMIRIQAKQKGLTFATRIPPELPTYVSTDEQRLHQILLNLLNNAIKFTEEGTVSLRVYELNELNELNGLGELGESKTQKLKNSKTQKLHFEVEDTGIGIPPQKIEAIFQPFEQIHDPQRKTEGTGLGLAISQTLVRMMGGELQVTSTVGQGSTFWFDIDLPVIEEGQHVESGVHPERRIIGYKGKPCTILLADDKPENRTLIIDMLAPLGFNIVEAVDGHDALDKARTCHPDLLLIDLVMPVLDGFEVIRRVRQLPAPLNEIVIISISASVFQETQQESAAAGADDFLGKPVQIDELLEKVQAYLNLEWIYEDNISDFGFRISDGQSPQFAIRHPERSRRAQSEIIPPPPEELSTLYQLVRTGSVIRLREHLQEFTASNPTFAAFGARIFQLADEFRLDDIERFIQQYMKRET